MAWYYGAFSCGCEGRVNVIGPIKDRQWKVDRKFEGLCEKCYAKKLESDREKANAEALKKSKEMELPELEGTEKQVAWANTLRQKMIEKFDEERKVFIKLNKETETLDKVLDHLLLNKTKASFYIDRRGSSVLSIIEKYKDEVDENIIEAKKVEKEIINEGAIFPENVKFKGIVEIRVTEDKIEIYYEKNETFRKLVKSLNYNWNGCWERKITETTGSYIDRAAEVGNKLLNEGFVISIQDEEIRTKAINGDYEKECHRWIYRRINTNKLAICWNEMNDSLYRASKRLPGARWDKGSMLVDVTRYKEVEEFAGMYGFKFSKMARELIEQYIEEFKNVNTIIPVQVKDDIKKDGLNDILNSSREILEDLMEED